MTDMKGQRAIVTGAGTGLGAATALALARQGVNVCINYASSADSAEHVADDCRKLGVEAFAVKADVGEDAGCRALVAAAVERFGGLDVLVNNAGITKFAKHGDLDALDAEDFQRLYRVNVIAVYQMTRAARPHMDAAGKGSVVNVSSIAGVVGIGSSIAYAASKGALNTMTLSLARALAPTIRVNAVCPGYIGSGWFTKYQGDAVEDKTARQVAETTPLRVASMPEDIAETILFFAGPQSRHVTGEFIIVDAGMHLGMAPLRAR
ncbi:MAG: SDR family oxidoreductase [Alphaproteobacteria bacterium]|nr:SDR family oxidoreductase [Alphaproteobacteria bacterium]